MIAIIGAIIWVVVNILILRFFYVCKSDRVRSKDSQDIRNEVEANSPYNDGWTQQFYKDKIEGIHFNKDEECVEMSLCTYFFTLFNIHKEHTFTILSKKGHTHLCGPTEKYKTEYIGGLSESKYLL